MFHSLTIAIVFIMLSGCAGSEEKSELLSLLGVDEKIVDTANQETDDTYDAITLLKRGEAYFVKGDPIEAIAEFKRFLSLHPFHRMAAFAQYKIAMSYFQQMHTIDRDPAPMEKALSSFQRVVSQYPNSLYLDEAQAKIKELKYRKNEYEFHIGHFYYRTNAYLAAIARFEKVLSVSEEDPLIEKTLYFLALSHFNRGNPEIALKTFRHLLEKYPESEYKLKTEQHLSKIGTTAPAS